LQAPPNEIADFPEHLEQQVQQTDAALHSVIVQQKFFLRDQLPRLIAIE
jgi:hypothetical protein